MVVVRAAQGHRRAANRIARDAVGHGAGDRAAGSDRSALGEFEGADLGQPPHVEGLRGRIGVLVGVPERAAVGVERHRAVVAPASWSPSARRFR